MQNRDDFQFLKGKRPEHLLYKLQSNTARARELVADEIKTKPQEILKAIISRCDELAECGHISLDEEFYDCELDRKCRVSGDPKCQCTPCQIAKKVCRTVHDYLKHLGFSTVEVHADHDQEWYCAKVSWGMGDKPCVVSLQNLENVRTSFLEGKDPSDVVPGLQRKSREVRVFYESQKLLARIVLEVDKRTNDGDASMKWRIANNLWSCDDHDDVDYGHSIAGSRCSRVYNQERKEYETLGTCEVCVASTYVAAKAEETLLAIGFKSCSIKPSKKDDDFYSYQPKNPEKTHFYDVRLEWEATTTPPDNVVLGECPICFEEAVPQIALPCKHTICDYCAGKIEQNERIRCPLCRQSTAAQDAAPALPSPTVGVEPVPEEAVIDLDTSMVSEISVGEEAEEESPSPRSVPLPEIIEDDDQDDL